MPLHLPHFASKSTEKHSSPQRRGSTSASEHDQSGQSSSPASTSQPSSILRPAGESSRSSIKSTESTPSTRFSSLSLNTDDTRSPGSSNRSPTTPATSVSSLSQCPLPPDRFPFFLLALSSTSTLQFIALPIHMRNGVLDAITRAWKRGVSKVGDVDYAPELRKKHIERGCENGVWEVVLKGDCWVPRSEDRVSSKRILINLMTEFAKEGYSLNSSFRTSAKDSGKDTLTFLRDTPDPDPIFFCVGFHSSDRVWIIDADAEVGQAIEEGIKEWWTDGVRDARVRERHCREIVLKGSPWTSHNASSLISARCIHIVIMKTATHHHGGYDYVGSVEMADKEEGHMPATFYRRRRRDQL